MDLSAMNKHLIVVVIITEEILHLLMIKIKIKKKKKEVWLILFMSLNKARNQNKVNLKNLRFRNSREQ